MAGEWYTCVTSFSDRQLQQEGTAKTVLHTESQKLPMLGSDVWMVFREHPLPWMTCDLSHDDDDG